MNNILRQTNVIYHHDSRKMKHLPNNSVHLMITSPPYNVGKEYEGDLSPTEYENLLHDVMCDTYRVLIDGGYACINIANVGRKPYIPLHLLVYEIARDIGYIIQNEIIWDKRASAGSSCAWGSWKSASNPVLRDVHEYILIFSKSLHERQSDADRTISKDEFEKYGQSIWQIQTESARRLKHAAPFPVELPRRLIQLYSFENDIVLDPFIGSGTTAIAAIDTNRRYIGYEIQKEYAFLAKARINEYGNVRG